MESFRHVTDSDVFLSYNRKDRQAVEYLATKLLDNGLRIFKDDWHLWPGQYWPQVLERKLSTSAAIVIFCGSYGFGSWQQREVSAALELQVLAEKAGDPIPIVIPVLLEEQSEQNAGLLFLRQIVWVKAWDPRFVDLISGAIQGKAPIELYSQDHDNPRRSVCPYRGFGVFREEDASFFFGRNAEVAKLQSVVERYPLVAVIGPSGCGKSSLVRAGLFPTLRRQRNEKVWQIVTIVPGRDPFLGLAYQLLPLREPKRFPNWDKLDIDDNAFRLRDYLESQGASYLLRIVEDILQEEPGTTHLILFVDQWEELYSYRPIEDDAAKAHDERTQRFITMLTEAVYSDTFQAIFTLRADFWGNVLNEQALMNRSIIEATVHLGVMDRECLKDIICKPAKIVDLALDDGLVELILRDAPGRAGDMPLLEFTLQRLWKDRSQASQDKLTVNAYEEFGGLKEAIITIADQLYQQLTQSERDAVPALFSALVLVDEHNVDLRRRAKMSELSETCRAVAKRFTDRRLLVTSRDLETDENMIEVAHEALLRHWPNLKGWINERRGALLVRRRIETDARTWQENGRKSSYLWSHDRVSDAVNAMKDLGPNMNLSANEYDFLGPIDPESMLETINRPETTHRERALIGERLDTLVDSREGIGLTTEGLPGITWCMVPGGVATIEVRSDPFDIHSRLVKRLSRRSESFSISRYPITVTQYRAFLEARDGWANNKWWSDDLYRDPDGLSYNFGRFGNYPAVYINWFDAMAFCRWLSWCLNQTINLPDECQWQLAAMGTDVDRLYPWGSEWDPRNEPHRANTFEGRLGRPISVGMYPAGASPHGILDMSGTVWEWCLDKFDMPDTTELSIDGFDCHALRGGSWNLSEASSLCVNRSWYFPDGRINDIGFRIVCSSPIDES